MYRKYIFIFTVVFQICLSYSAVTKTKRVCVVGAGIAGISAARYLKEEGIEFTVYESTQYVGGTWRFDPRVGTDENGLPLHTSMYKNLRTNLPKPTMELRGFPLPEHLPSFPSWRDYYQYLQDYAKHFNVLDRIKFLHNVLLVRRVGDVWRVKHQHVRTNETFEDEFDYVIIGNGHFSKPNMPNIPGEDRFKGKIIHSHDYKEPEPYRNRRVLVVGAGPSGMDIGLDVAEVAKTLIHSHHSKINFTTPFPPHYHKKPDIQEFIETGVIFKDGSYEEIDDVIYCTGFQYDIPFLDESSGLTLSSKSIVPLYRYMVNINQPSMILMGLIVRACLVVALDAQARYATAIVKGNFTLPPQEEMMQEWQKRMNAIRSKGLPSSYIHVLAEKETQEHEVLDAHFGTGLARFLEWQYSSTTYRSQPAATGRQAGTAGRQQRPVTPERCRSYTWKHHVAARGSAWHRVAGRRDGGGGIANRDDGAYVEPRGRRNRREFRTIGRLTHDTRKAYCRGSSLEMRLSLSRCGFAQQG